MSLVLFWRDDNVLPLEKTRTPWEFTNDSEKFTIQVHCSMIHFTGCSKRKLRDLAKLTKDAYKTLDHLKHKTRGHARQLLPPTANLFYLLSLAPAHTRVFVHMHRHTQIKVKINF